MSAHCQQLAPLDPPVIILPQDNGTGVGGSMEGISPEEFWITLGNTDPGPWIPRSQHVMTRR